MISISVFLSLISLSFSQLRLEFTKKTSKKITYKGNKKFTKTVKKLKGGKKYYVRVRTYTTKKVNGKTVKLYSSWSASKTVTTKK